MYVLGISGPQGSGKSTLTRLLAERLRDRGLRVATLSLDDLYLSRAQRHRLAEHVHPLLATRGVPGTHDVALGLHVLRRLREGATDVRMPRFDKASDEPWPVSRWPCVCGPVDVLIFEGWCLALPAQPAWALRAPINRLEREADADGRWRRYVNHRLARDYPPLFAAIDTLLFLAVPSWRAILRWRMQQETALPRCRRMDRARLGWFVRHFERLTRHAMQVLPARADIVFRLDERHAIAEAHYRI